MALTPPCTKTVLVSKESLGKAKQGTHNFNYNQSHEAVILGFAAMCVLLWRELVQPRAVAGASATLRVLLQLKHKFCCTSVLFAARPTGSL